MTVEWVLELKNPEENTTTANNIVLLNDIVFIIKNKIIWIIILKIFKPRKKFVFLIGGASYNWKWQNKYSDKTYKTFKNCI